MSKRKKLSNLRNSNTYLGCISSILEGIGNKDKDIDLAIQEILGKIKDSREKHPSPEDFGY